MESFQTIENWTCLFLSCFDWKTCIVERANDLIANQTSFGQIESEVGTFALKWVDGSLIVDHKNGVFGFGADK